MDDDRRSAIGGDAAGDQLIAIEGVIGSTLDDELTGSGARERLDGGAGNDRLAGGGGRRRPSSHGAPRAVGARERRAR